MLYTPTTRMPVLSVPSTTKNHRPEEVCILIDVSAASETIPQIYIRMQLFISTQLTTRHSLTEYWLINVSFGYLSNINAIEHFITETEDHCGNSQVNASDYVIKGLLLQCEFETISCHWLFLWTRNFTLLIKVQWIHHPFK